MTNEKDREEARKEAFEFAKVIHKGFDMQTQYHPVDKVLEHDARIRAEAVEAERERIGRRANMYLSDLLNSKLIKHDKGAMSGKNLKMVIDIILSDDQGAAHVQR